MRDGIYKTLPVPRWWKKVLRSCERESERGETLQRAAASAIEKDALMEITLKFLKGLKQVIASDEASFPGFGNLQSVRDVRELGGMNTPLENDVLAKARQLEKNGLRGQDIFLESCIQSFKQRQESIFRQAQQHYLYHVGKEAGPYLSILRDAQATVPVEDLAKRLLNGKRGPVQKIHRGINVDFDDLSVPL